MVLGTKGSAGQEHVVAVAAVALVGIVGFARLGGAMGEGIAGDADGGSSQQAKRSGSQGTSGGAPRVVVGAEAGVFSGLHKFNRVVFQTADDLDVMRGTHVRRRAAVGRAKARVQHGEDMARAAVGAGAGLGTSAVISVVPAGLYGAARGVGAVGATAVHLTGEALGVVKRGVFAVGHNLRTAYRNWIRRPGPGYRNVVDEMRPKAWAPRELEALRTSNGGVAGAVAAGFENLGVRWRNLGTRVSNRIGEWYHRSTWERAWRARLDTVAAHSDITDAVHQRAVGPAIVGASKLTKYPQAVVDDFLVGLARVPEGGDVAVSVAVPVREGRKVRQVVDYGDEFVRAKLAGTEVDGIVRTFEGEWDRFRETKALNP